MVRYKNRYLTMEVVRPVATSSRRPAAPALDAQTLLIAVRDSMQLNFGDHGLGQEYGSLQVKYVGVATNVCVVRCSRDNHRQVWGAMTLLTELGGRAAQLRLANLSGNVANCRKATLQLEKRRLATAVAAGAVDSARADKLLELTARKLAAIET